MRTLSVTVTVSPLVTGDPSTSIDTVSTGGLETLGVQLKEKIEPMVKATALRGVTNSGGSVEEQCTFYKCQCNRIETVQMTFSFMKAHTGHPE